MKPINLFFATLVLACFAFFPGAVHADDLDDLDVTMEVIDDVAGLDFAIAEMEGPDDVGDFDDGADEESEYDGVEGEEEPVPEDDYDEIEDEFENDMEGDFEHDEDFDDEELDEEDDFEHEEGEDVDDDEYDEIDEDDEMDETEDDAGEETDDDVV